MKQEDDPTNGFVDYIDVDQAKSSGLTKIVDGKVFLGVDNTTVVPDGARGRKSIVSLLVSVLGESEGWLLGDVAFCLRFAIYLWRRFSRYKWNLEWKMLTGRYSGSPPMTNSPTVSSSAISPICQLRIVVHGQLCTSLLLSPTSPLPLPPLVHLLFSTSIH